MVLLAPRPFSISPPFEAVAAHGAAFKAALSPADLDQLLLARGCFHAAWLAPLALYTVLEPRPRLFPMSVSWTVRRGLPRVVHQACWVAGWALFVGTAVRSTGRSFVSGFAAQMFATGAVATIACPLGSGRRLQDAVHWFAALLYITDHTVLFGLLSMPRRFVAGFWACFGLMAASQPATTPDAARQEARRRGTAAESRVAEACFMLGEYGLFVTFICGMLAGLR